MADVLIAGGAVMGASCAYWLTRMSPGLRVVVVEPDPSYQFSSTALSVASIRSQFTNPVNVQISRFGIDFIRDFVGNTGPAGGVPDLGLRENGYLFLTGTDAGAAQLAELAEMQRGLGAGTEVWDAATLARRYPWMNSDDVVAASFGPRDEGWFDNMGLLSGLRNAARAAGARFVTGRVVRFEADGDRVTAAMLEDGQRFEASHFVNAAGTRCDALMDGLPLRLPVEPRKRTVFVVDAPDARHPDAPLFIDHSGIYARPEHGCWIAATVPADDGPCDPDDFEPRHDLFEDEVWPALYHRAEGFAAARVVRWWVGHYAYNTLDQNAILGRNPLVPNLYHANGFSGHGLQQAPAVGRGIAEQILHGDWQTLDLSPLGVQRVIDRQPFAEAHIV
ncbi:MAG: FAD-binding oxidoreductase [Paracoccus sp. (in: a-proteobacteria)]|uniref:NAD(P)/FAD-dependent oxidoreductase n=1 Tax=Paracoccus sp. TaxID=267 RepID=UPI0026DF3016|nr:FAD-binding oxidoreductase [Paracoccus sp. (in: a-proteobacteria)]MDO5619941.1 FAD-binding oxidoreductase [Paracoccus sp. (in: a-proteobacteria)]